MNELLAPRYSEIVHRLAAGIEPVDALSGARAGAGARVRLEYPRHRAAVAPLAHAGGRWSIRYVRDLPDHADVVIEDPSRRLVPRRLRLPFAAESDVRDAERAGGHVPAAQRTWRPALFPGAAYRLAASATAIRGRASRAGAPARWVRVEARPQGGADVLWRAHGDDRGEFLLAIGPDPSAPAQLAAVIAITIDVWAANPAPVPAQPPAADPFWDLPLQTLVPPGPDDDVSRGVTLPPNHKPGGFHASRDVDLVVGRVQADPLPFDLV